MFVDYFRRVCVAHSVLQILGTDSAVTLMQCSLQIFHHESEVAAPDIVFLALKPVRFDVVFFAYPFLVRARTAYARDRCSSAPPPQRVSVRWFALVCVCCTSGACFRCVH